MAVPRQTVSEALATPRSWVLSQLSLPACLIQNRVPLVLLCVVLVPGRTVNRKVCSTESGGFPL